MFVVLPCSCVLCYRISGHYFPLPFCSLRSLPPPSAAEPPNPETPGYNQPRGSARGVEKSRTGGGAMDIFRVFIFILAVGA